MLGGVSGFINRHRRKILIATGVAAGAYIITDYLKQKLLELQDRLATEQAARENLKRRFEQNQEDATFTIMALLPSLTSQIMEKYSVEKITQELQAIRAERRDAASSTLSEASSVVSDSQSQSQSESQSKSQSPSGSVSKRSKTQLWNDLKIQSLTRAIVLIYCSALLVFFTRLQLNILGRKDYVMSVIRLAKHDTDDDNVDAAKNKAIALFDQDELNNLALEEHEALINRMYLTFSWWLLNKGWISLSQRIEQSVINVFGEVSPRQDLTLQKFSELLGKVQYEVDHSLAATDIGSLNLGAGERPQASDFMANLLPPKELESYVLVQAPSIDSRDIDKPRSEDGINGDTANKDSDDIIISPPLRKLLDETSDFIESPNATNVIHKLVHAGLTVFVSKVAQSTAFQSGGVDSTCKLANILASATRQAQSLSSGTPLNPNDYISAMINVAELDGFSALVYSSFDWSNINVQ